jgi:hypothetical protein
MSAPRRTNHQRCIRSLWLVPVATFTVLASPARTSLEDDLSSSPSVEVVDVRIVPPSPPASRWGVEEAGLVTALLEDGLLHLDRVVPTVVGAPVLPSLAEPLAVGRVVDATIRLADVEPRVVALTLCERDQPEGCWEDAATAPDDRLHEAVGALVAGAAPVLGSTRPAAPPEAPSPDPYAVLLLGRAAATLYGIAPRVAPASRGDRRADPIARAVHVDARMAVGQGLALRAALDRGDLQAAFEHAFARADVGTAVQALDLAAVSSLLGRPDRAAEMWEVWPTVLRDPRFVEPALAALLAADRVQDVQEALQRLPGDLRNQPPIVEIEVSLHERKGDLDLEERDALLARWQEADPTDPSPVRERLAIHASTSGWEEIEALADALETRAHPREAAGWRLVAALALDDRGRARRAALATGDFEIAARVERRFAEDDPLAAPGPIEAENLFLAADRALATAERAGRALGEAQNAAVLAGARCDPSQAPEVGVLGVAHRAAVEAAGEKWRALEEIWKAPTLAPLRDAEVELRLRALHDAIRRQVAITLEVGSWFLGNGAGLSSACTAA